MDVPYEDAALFWKKLDAAKIKLYAVVGIIASLIGGVAGFAAMLFGYLPQTTALWLLLVMLACYLIGRLLLSSAKADLAIANSIVEAHRK